MNNLIIAYTFNVNSNIFLVESGKTSRFCLRNMKLALGGTTDLRWGVQTDLHWGAQTDLHWGAQMDLRWRAQTDFCHLHHD